MASQNSFNEFLKKFRKSLHEYSADTLDIYFNKSDLKYNNGTYFHPEIMQIQGQKSDIPCLLIWDKFTSKPIIVKLYDFKDVEIFEVVKHFIDFLENNNDFSRSIDNLIHHIEQYKGGKNVNNGIIINGNKNKVEKININLSESQQTINNLQNEITKMYDLLVKNSSRTEIENGILIKLIDIQQVAHQKNLQELQNAIKDKSNSEFLNFAKNVGASLFASFLMS